MGAHLARNAARNGFRVAVYDRNPDRTQSLLERSGHEGAFTPAQDPEDFIASLAAPRAIVLMVEAGDAVDGVVEELRPLLDAGDTIVDAGNSHHADTGRRVDAVALSGLRFLGWAYPAARMAP